MKKLTVETWTARVQKNAALVVPFTDSFLKRRSLGVKDPVYDFLFTYYTSSPLKLKQWVPSFEESLTITPEILNTYPWFKKGWFVSEKNELFLDKKQIGENTLGIATFIAQMCKTILERPPRFGCFGLHEWAMVYKLSPEAIRHKGYNLRLPKDELATFVESQTLCCSHYDAYRFFTKDAHPLNTLNPTIDNRLEMEQGGCVHANMDLYKWATKLWPWIGSDFITKTFLLAMKGRELDMRASPYDLTDQGYDPICIETEAGRKEYQREQQLLTAEATPLRDELGEFCKRLILENSTTN